MRAERAGNFEYLKCLPPPRVRLRVPDGIQRQRNIQYNLYFNLLNYYRGVSSQLIYTWVYCTLTSTNMPMVLKTFKFF